MNSQLKTLAISSVICCSAVFTATATEPSAKEVNRFMADAEKSLSTLIPLAYDDEKFRAESQKKLINDELSKLTSLFDKKADLLGSQTDTAFLSLKVLQNHLKETQSLYQSGYYAMSQYLVTNTPSICATCHVQDSAHSALGNAISREQFANDFSLAEYLFTVRQYDKAEKLYQSYLSQPEVKESRFRFIKPLERLVTIELGIRQSPGKTLELLKTQHKSVAQIEIKAIIHDWIEGTQEISSAGSKDLTHLTELFSNWFSSVPNSTHEFILEEKIRPKAIWLRAQLFNELKTIKDREEIANSLYMISIIDRVLGQDEPYSFSNLYLKQCVVSYPETKGAKKCLDEYQNHLSFYYGGSAGEAVPEELINEYNSMKNILEANQK